MEEDFGIEKTYIYMLKEIRECIVRGEIKEFVLVAQSIEAQPYCTDSFSQLVYLVVRVVVDLQKITIREELDFAHVMAKVCRHLAKQLPGNLVNLARTKHIWVKGIQVIYEVLVGYFEYYAVKNDHGGRRVDSL